jgi:predicted nucleotidyltransferase
MIASPEEIRAGLIMKRLQEHYDESLQYFKPEEIVGIFLQGSQNYGLDYEGSDIDTKLIVVPSFKDICLNKKPVSTTHIRANEEHIDFKDIRLYMETFRKQNLNFLEILFTDFYIINPMYKEQWGRLVAAREQIARMNPHRAVKSMKGVAMEKYHAMERRYPSKVDIIDKYGYDGKQVSHQIRVYDYLRRYIAGEDYKSCLRPSDYLFEQIMDYKKLNVYSLEEARGAALAYIQMTIDKADAFCATHPEEEDPAMRELLEDVSYNIMKIAVEKELGA